MLSVEDRAIAVPNLKLTSASGHKIPFRGVFELRFNVQGHVGHFPFFVVKHASSHCILGSDFMSAFDYSVRPRRGVAERVSEGKEEEAVASNSMTLLRATTLPPFSETVTEVEISTSSRMAMVNPLGQRVYGHLAVTCPGLVSVSDHKASVVLSNPSNSQVSIPKGTRLGRWEDCELDETGDLSCASVHPSSAGMTKKKPKHVPVNLDNVPANYKERYQGLLDSFSHVVNDESTDIGKCTLVKQVIKLKDPTKVACTPPYRIPEALKPVVDQFVDNLLEAGVIRSSNSPFSSPLMLVKKAGADPSKPVMEQYRVVNDFRKLNANTVRDSYPMQNIYQLIDQVAAAKVATVIDLRSAFFLQELAEDSRKYTSFPVPGKGLFEYCRSAQGLVNSPSTFQRLLDKLMEGLPNVRVYIDDIVVYNSSHEEHLESLRQVLSRLAKHGFKCSVKKLQVACGSLHYLGYEIRPGKSIRPGEAKTKAIVGWPEPADLTQIKQFLGLCSFFRRTIPNFAHTAAPLTRLTRKDSGYKAGPLPVEAREAFIALRQTLSRRPALAPVRYDREFILTTDASTKALGAVLSQRDANGTERPCAYYSRALSEREQKLAPFHLEHLAMTASCKHFRPYLSGVHFKLRTDHKPLVSLNRIQGQSFERLKLELEEFDFTVEYLRGADMIADGLSRAIPNEVSEIEIGRELSFNEVKMLQQADVTCKALACAVLYQTFPADTSLRRIVGQHWKKLTMAKGILRTKSENQIVAPVALRPWILKMAHDHELAGHWGPAKTTEKVTSLWWWPRLADEVSRYCRACHHCASSNPGTNQRPERLLALEEVTRTFQRVHVDLLQMPTSSEGHKYLVVLVDAFSRVVELVPIKSKEAEVVSEAIITGWVCRYGCPESFCSDQGKEFVNEIHTNLCNQLGIKLAFTTAGHPASNGRVERVNRTLLAYFRKYISADSEWLRQVPFARFALNTSSHSSTLQTPFYLLHFNDPLLPHELLLHPQPNYSERADADLLRRITRAYRETEEFNSAAFIRQKEAYDKRTQKRAFRVGDRVYITSSGDAKLGKKLRARYDGPFFVEKLLSSNNLLLRRNRGRKLVRVHYNRVKVVPTTPLFGIENNIFKDDEQSDSPSASNLPSGNRHDRTAADQSDNASPSDISSPDAAESTRLATAPNAARAKSGSNSNRGGSVSPTRAKRRYQRRPLPAQPDGPRTRGDHRRYSFAFRPSSESDVPSTR